VAADPIVRVVRGPIGRADLAGACTVDACGDLSSAGTSRVRRGERDVR
jgi:hypothetical protein